jgi:protoheme IX farnesyltransferase
MSILMTTSAGFMLGAQSWAQVFDGFWLLMGTALSAGSAGTLNHYLESEHDARMVRTKQRPLPSGKLRPLAALSFGVFLGLAGLSVLLIFLNPLTAFLAGLTVALYIWVYTPLKRHSTLNTLVGAIPGALPPLAGWTAATNRLDVTALLLFLVFFFWQMPHFYALAWMYRDDYREGGFVMLPVVDAQGSRTARATLFYSILLSLSGIALGIQLEAGILYYSLVGLLAGSLSWMAFRMGLKRDRPAAVRVFLGSLLFLPGFVLTLLLERVVSFYISA